MPSVDDRWYIHVPKFRPILSNEWDPPEVHQKLEALQIQKQTIKDLISHHQNARDKYSRSEAEIYEGRTSVAPIRKCPEDVLLMIFESHTKNDPQKVARLLRVCRKWYSIAVNAPRLWCHIKFFLGATYNHQKEAKHVNRWIKTCLQRSGSLPLHIHVNLSDLKSGPELLTDRLCEHLMGADISVDIDEARNALQSSDLQDLISDRWNQNPTHALESIALLVGEKGRNMQRWKTLKIIWPEFGDLGAEISEVFRGSAPNLTSISIGPISYPHPIDFSGFSDLVSLENLELSGSIRDLGGFGLNPTSLKRLDIEHNLESDHQYLTISRYINLEQLKIRHYPFSVSVGPIPGIKICLPRLTSLDLDSSVYGGVMWEVPALHSLKFRVSGRDLLRGLPDVPAVRVCWNLKEEQNPETDSDKSDALKKIITQYPKMECLEISATLKSHWVNIERELAEKQGASYHLPSVAYLKPFNRYLDDPDLRDIPFVFGG